LFHQEALFIDELFVFYIPSTGQTTSCLKPEYGRLVEPRIGSYLFGHRETWVGRPKVFPDSSTKYLGQALIFWGSPQKPTYKTGQ
jgi:hypothetical protein